MILKEATIKYSGVDPDNLKSKSNKRICISCDQCGRVRWQRKQHYSKLCLSCSNKSKMKKQQLIKAHIGKHHSEETKRKISESHKGKQKSKEHKANISKSHIGFKHSKESRQKMSNSRKGKNNPNYGNGDKIKGSNNPNWKGGLSKQPYCNLWTKSFRQAIRNRFNNKCYLCNKTQTRKLSVHHVNYDKNCLCQKTCEFVPLCHSCHSKTNHNRQYWEDLIMNYLYPNRYFMIEI